MSSEEKLKAAPDREIAQTLAKGLEVIAAFGPEARAMTIADTARRTGFSRATARRLLRTLEAMGYAVLNGDRYSLTPKILTLGFSFLRSSEIGDRVNPILRRASDQMRETCSLGLPSGTDMVYVAHAICEDRLFSTRFTIGARLPMAATALGRAYLSSLSEEERRAFVLDLTPRSETPNTVIDRKILTAVLDKAVARGFAVTEEEYEMGALSVAVPVRNTEGKPIAGINVVVNKGRVSIGKMEREFVPILQDAAKDVGLAIG